jgi:hypothetical protein
VEGEAGGSKSTLLSRFLGSLANAVVLEVGGDEAETLFSYGIIDQLQLGTLTEPGTDPMAAGTPLPRPRRAMTPASRRTMRARRRASRAGAGEDEGF